MTNYDLQSFLNTAAHDLKSPLRRIVSYCAMLREDAAPRLKEDELTMLTRIETNTLRLQDLVENLLLLSRLHTTPANPQDTDIETLIRDLSVSVPTLENETRICDIQPLPHIMAHPRELKELFKHLIQNAQIYADPTRPLQLRINASRHNNQIIISFIDNGIGIAPDYQDDIIEPFKRLHTQDDIEGSGLGLSICEKILERHNGSLSLESKPNVGSTFTVKLPIP